jgi:hypothetical protein
MPVERNSLLRLFTTRPHCTTPDVSVLIPQIGSVALEFRGSGAMERDAYDSLCSGLQQRDQDDLVGSRTPIDTL